MDPKATCELYARASVYAHFKGDVADENGAVSSSQSLKTNSPLNTFKDINMQTTKELQGRATANARAAQHLLNEMGGQKWSQANQTIFDSLVDESERAGALLELRRIEGGSPVAKWAQQRAGLEQFLREGKVSSAASAGLRNAMSTTTPSEGGYLVPTLVAADLVMLLKGYGWMRQVADQITTSTGATLAYPASDGTSESGELLTDNAPSTNADMTFLARGLNTCKVGSKVFTVPVELLQDSAVDLVAMVLQRAAERIGRTQNQLFTNGTGVAQPTGLVTAASVGKVGIAGQTLTLIYDDLADLADSVDEAHLGMPTKPGMPQTTAGWMLSQSMRKVVRKLKDSSGRPIWTPAIGSELPQLLDYPVFVNSDMPSPGANAKSVAFGNLRSYLIRDALELKILRFDDSAFALKGQVGFLAIARTGGNLLDTGAVKLYQHSAT